MAKKKSPQATGLLEAWLGYIYNDHRCPTGLRALKFLRTCLAKGILTNKAVWEAASQEIKDGFYSQWGRPNLPKPAQMIQNEIEHLNQALAEIINKKSPSRKAILDEKKVLTDRLSKLTPNLCPGTKVSRHDHTLLYVTWDKASE